MVGLMRHPRSDGRQGRHPAVPQRLAAGDGRDGVDGLLRRFGPRSRTRWAPTRSSACLAEGAWARCIRRVIKSSGTVTRLWEIKRKLLEATLLLDHPEIRYRVAVRRSLNLANPFGSTTTGRRR